MPGNFCTFCKINCGPRDRSCPNCLRPFSSADGNSKMPLGFSAKSRTSPENTNLVQSFNQNAGILILGGLIFLLIGVFALLTISSDSGHGEDMFKKLLPRTAWIRTNKGCGSGCLISSEKKLVITNNHVIAGNTDAIVFFPKYSLGVLVTKPMDYVNNRDAAIPAKVVYANPEKDIAFLELASVPDDAKEMFRTQRSPEVGSKVFVLGQSGINFTPTEISGTLWRISIGTVRQVYDKEIHYKQLPLVKAKITETQTATNKGDSGGPVVNDRGDLVAIVTGGDGTSNGVDYNIDITEINKCLEAYLKSINKANP